eukprot:GEMP01036382.1.p1 GENE.GEMP01036382.1~~GEMP01036382.1.p1  ORF type:complete len:293 (+),score=68.46 GEMP01036382.1:276-1154(+)
MFLPRLPAYQFGLALLALYFIFGPFVAILAFFGLSKPDVDAFPSNSWFHSPKITNCFFFFYARDEGQDFIGICYHWINVNGLANSDIPIVRDAAKFLVGENEPPVPESMQDRMVTAFDKGRTTRDKNQCAAALDMARRLGNHHIVLEAAKIMDTTAGYTQAFEHLVAHEVYHSAMEIAPHCPVDVLLACGKDCAAGNADDILRHVGLRMLERDGGDIIGLDLQVESWLCVQPSLVARPGVAFLVDVLYAVQNQDNDTYEDLCKRQDRFHELKEWEVAALLLAKPIAHEVDLT